MIIPSNIALNWRAPTVKECVTIGQNSNKSYDFANYRAVFSQLHFTNI